MPDNAAARKVVPFSPGQLRRDYRQAVADADLERAARLAEQIAGSEPENALSQRLASHALVQAGQPERALAYALRARELDPQDLAHRLHAGALLNRLQDHSGALMMLTPALDHPERSAELYHQIAVASDQLGDGERALDMAARAWRHQPERPARAIFLANLQARREMWQEAIGTLRSLEECGGGSALSKRMLSGFYVNVGDADAALAAIDAALREAPARPDFQIHRIAVLRRLGRLDEAREAIERVLASDPDNLNLRRQAVTIYTEAGDLKKALQNGAQLLARAPEVEEYASCMRFLLEARDTSALKEEIGDIAQMKSEAPARRYRPPPTFREKARGQANVIGALVLREIRARYGRNRLGFLWAIVGPAAHIAILAVIFGLSGRANPPLGGNYFFYYYTGVVPFLLLSQVITQSGHAVMGNRGLLQLPDITPTDLLVSKAIVEMFTIAVVILLFGAVFVALGLPGLPDRPGPVLASLGLTWVLGLGLGAIYASLLEFGKLAETAFTVLIRATYFTSGIFFLPASVPENLRVYLYWNPFVHLVDLGRAGYYPFYDGATTSAPYAGVVSVFLLASGGIMLRVVSAGMRTQK